VNLSVNNIQLTTDALRQIFVLVPIQVIILGPIVEHKPDATRNTLVELDHNSKLCFSQTE
jgi:hypothetical protein